MKIKRLLLKAAVIGACWVFMLSPVWLIRVTGQSAWIWCCVLTIPVGSLAFSIVNAKL